MYKLMHLLKSLWSQFTIKNKYIMGKINKKKNDKKEQKMGQMMGQLLK